MMSKKLKSEIKKLKILLITLTLIQASYIIIVFLNAELWIELDFEYKVNWLIWRLHLIVMGIFIWFNCTRLPIEKKTKINNIFMILFLGIIGMWLWVPNQREINNMIEKQ
jgi:cell division protein FtsW (lipid II flippase)